MSPQISFHDVESQNDYRLQEELRQAEIVRDASAQRALRAEEHAREGQENVDRILALIARIAR